MKTKFKALLSAFTAFAVSLSALPIAEVSVLAEELSRQAQTSASEESDGAPLKTAANTGVTRAEWIHELVTVFEMSVEDDSTWNITIRTLTAARTNMT